MAAQSLSGSQAPGGAAGFAQRSGPFQDGSGNLWIVGSGASPNGVVIWRSTDGGATWPSSWGIPNTTVFSANWDTVFNSATGIFYTLVYTQGTQMNIYAFTISTTSWARFDTGTGPQPQQDGGLGLRPAHLNRRSDGTFVVVYQGPTASNMGTPYRQVYYAVVSAAGV